MGGLLSSLPSRRRGEALRLRRSGLRLRRRRSVLRLLLRLRLREEEVEEDMLEYSGQGCSDPGPPTQVLEYE